MGAPSSGTTATTKNDSDESKKNRMPSPRVSMKKFFRRNSKSSSSLEQTAGNEVAPSSFTSTTSQTLGSPPLTKKKSNSKRGILNLIPSISKSKADSAALAPKNTSTHEEHEHNYYSSHPSNHKTEGLATIVLQERHPDERMSTTHNNPNNTSPKRDALFQWQDEREEQERRQKIQQKQLLKERDGFCRRVDTYDGQVIAVDGIPIYELGNYLGGGVAGVVYEGHRLRPMEEYPVRLGQYDSLIGTTLTNIEGGEPIIEPPPVPERIRVESFLCITTDPAHAVNDEVKEGGLPTQERVNSLLSDASGSVRNGWNAMPPSKQPQQTAEMALEATASRDRPVLIDDVDAPSRSKHYAKAILNDDSAFPSDASLCGLMDDTVAVKVLNPVGFRTLSSEVTNTAVVAREGESLTPAMLQGKQPMEEKHVWWLINPNSRNLRTLQRYSPDMPKTQRRVEVDRGSPEKGLRISLIAAYKDQDGVIKELPLTRCIEIWGHVPFGASDSEFKQIMTAIDRINQGLPPTFLLDTSGNLFDVPGRVGTGGTTETSSTNGSSSVEELKSSASPMTSKRTGIYRAASTERKTVFCHELKAYIALPAVPSKYLKWLRQRRAATKEIRNMMLIGRHRNVVHLFEVLEYIQETKSTMFLILELVRGGELFDLISNNSARMSSTDAIPRGYTESETIMRKFFRELASGVEYCHKNGIAHRDLKPENLLVHNSRNGNCTLKIADFGLSAAFGPNSQSQTDTDTVVESLAPNGGGSVITNRLESDASLASSPQPSPMKERVDKILTAGNSAISFLTCGAVEDIINCNPRAGELDDTAPSPLKRMTSVVGSPHYVAPEIISQNEGRRKSKDDAQQMGYDGTKADVWSAGVILYAMLFRSLPFGEDLLRCPRYQSFKKWYDEVKQVPGGRRSSIMAALDPVITEVDQRDFLGPHWFFPSESSPESRDLIVYMLDPDPSCRPNIQMVLQHPWLIKKA